MKLFRTLLAILSLALTPAQAATFYIQTTGATTNSGTTDTDSATLTGTAISWTSGNTTLTLDGSPDLSGLSTSGATQAAIHITNATNSNQKIFKISAVDNGAKTVTVTVAPTCSSCNGNWSIGGRHVLTNASIEGAVTAGDTVIFNNSPASRSGASWTVRASGDATNGPVTIKGVGTKPILSTTGTATGFHGNNQTGVRVENLDIDQQGATGSGMTVYNGWTLYNVRVSNAGGECITAGNVGVIIIASEITGCGTAGISSIAQGSVLIGNYIHGVGVTTPSPGVLITSTGPHTALVHNVIANNTGKGVYLNASVASFATAFFMYGNTIYGNTDSGLETNDVDYVITLQNNIFQENGDGANEYNIEPLSGSTYINSFNNIYYHSNCQGSAGSGSCVQNFTLHSTDIASSAAMNNPASGDFTISQSSPAANAGYPGQLLGATGLGYQSIGAMQPQVTSGSIGRSMRPGLGGR